MVTVIEKEVNGVLGLQSFVAGETCCHNAGYLAVSVLAFVLLIMIPALLAAEAVRRSPELDDAEQHDTEQGRVGQVQMTEGRRVPAAARRRCKNDVATGVLVNACSSCTATSSLRQNFQVVGWSVSTSSRERRCSGWFCCCDNLASMSKAWAALML